MLIKLFLLIFLNVLCFPSSDEVSSTIANVNELRVQQRISDTNMNENGSSYGEFFSYYIINNNDAGYLIQIKSDNGSQLLHEDYVNESCTNANCPGKFQTYEIIHDDSTDWDGNGTYQTCSLSSPGFFPQTYIGDDYSSSPLSTSNITLAQLDDPIRTSKECEYEVLIVVASDYKLFSGEFSDNITLTVSNN